MQGINKGQAKYNNKKKLIEHGKYFQCYFSIQTVGIANL